MDQFDHFVMKYNAQSSTAIEAAADVCRRYEPIFHLVDCNGHYERY